MCHHVARLLFHNAQSFNKVFLKLYAKFCSLEAKYNTGINSEWPKMGILNLSIPFKCKKTGRNLEWPKLGIPNLFKSVMVCNGLESNKICTFLGVLSEI